MSTSKRDLLRTVGYNLQVRASLVYRALSIVFMFALVPIIIEHLGSEAYGVWATMLTLVSWFILLDLGVGNTVRNHVARYVAENDADSLAREVSTAYFVCVMLSLFFILLYLTFRTSIDWQEVFNSKVLGDKGYIDSMDFLILGLACNVPLSLVFHIYHGMQLSSLVIMAQMMTNLIVLAIVSVLVMYSFSLLDMVVVYVGVLIFTNFIFSLFLFYKNPGVRPRLANFKSSSIRPLFSVGIQFFFIQCAVLVVLMADKLIISQLLGPSFVAGYDVVFRLFSIFTLIHSLFLVPLWSSYSNAYAMGDMVWIGNQIRKQLIISCLLVLAAIVLGWAGHHIVGMWIGRDVSIDPMLFWVFVIYVSVSMWNNIFAYLVNALGELKIQMITSIVAALLNIPLSIYFVKGCGLGVEGVVYSTICCLLIYSLFGPLQVYRILRS